ncbi:unnamed protein product [Cochlearia groenlandica]
MKKVRTASAKTAVKDEWVAAAMTDNQMVAELLIRLKHSDTVVSRNSTANLPPLRWGIRQRRSRPSRFGVSGGGDALVSVKKDVDSARGSPKTPLSWSDGSGSSGGDSASPSVAIAGGFDYTSRQTSCSAASTRPRSKVFLTNEITSSFSKRFKKMKSTTYELKDQENLKLKERLHLHKEIASLQATYDQQNVRNQKLKRIKLDLNKGRVKKESSPVNLIRKPLPESRVENQGSFFFLPDLNMVPSEDEILYGTS